MPAHADNDKRYKLAEALAAGATVAAAARAVGFSERTAYRLRRDPEFQRMEDAARERQAQGAIDPDERLALTTLRQVARDQDQPGTARVSAAKALAQLAAERRKGRAPTEGRVDDKPDVRVLMGEARQFLAGRKG